MNDRYIIDGSEIINHSNTEWEIILYFKNNRLNKKYELKDFIKLVNDMNKELMDLRLENTKNKLVFRGIVEDLEEQAKSKEPVIISMEYVDWIKEHSDLRLNGEKCLDEKSKGLQVTTELINEIKDELITLHGKEIPINYNNKYRDENFKFNYYGLIKKLNEALIKEATNDE